MILLLNLISPHKNQTVTTPILVMLLFFHKIFVVSHSVKFSAQFIGHLAMQYLNRKRDLKLGKRLIAEPGSETVRFETN